MSQPDHDGTFPGETEFKDGSVWVWNGTRWRSGNASEQRSDRRVVDADEKDLRIDEDR